MTGALNGRVKRLERREPPPAPGLPEDLDGELDRWEALLAPAAALLAHDAEAVEVLYERAEDWADALVGIPEWYRPDAWAEKVAEVRRWPGACALFFRRCPPDRAAAAAKWGLACAPLPAERPGLSVYEAQRWGWLHGWLIAATRLECRLPPDVAPDALGRVIRVYLERYTEVAIPGRDVCSGCGLERPRRHVPMDQWKVLPGKVPGEGPPPWYEHQDFFPACPHCGDKVAWPLGRTLEQPFPWRDLARSELNPDA
jgi:hypothetical protein